MASDEVVSRAAEPNVHESEHPNLGRLEEFCAPRDDTKETSHDLQEAAQSTYAMLCLADRVLSAVTLGFGAGSANFEH